ncbi:hypothetical protein FOA19_22805 [Rufibacter hautae]|uniref:Uncharacterized protein n=2 Tax=Rufibacter hautae TaxID=2595005 RepID=A0A5B6TIJ8_9BACT|nr:beta-barrel fold lipoprotein [Rufibacter hautae]KAA3435982.1 hypothetical protein FOA19_22805 [Rufibacter hautae]
MRKYYHLLVLILLFSCSEDKDINPDGGTYKVVIEQAGDFTNYNKSLIAVTPDVDGQTLKFYSVENNQTTDNYLDNSDLSSPTITLVSQNPSREIEFNFIISPIPVTPATAGPMTVKFTLYKDGKLIGEKSFSYLDDFDVKQENLKFR